MTPPPPPPEKTDLHLLRHRRNCLCTLVSGIESSKEDTSSFEKVSNITLARGVFIIKIIFCPARFRARKFGKFDINKKKYALQLFYCRMFIFRTNLRTTVYSHVLYVYINESLSVNIFLKLRCVAVVVKLRKL